MIPYGGDELASSDEENYDSDRIESDIEAELYSVVHHEADNSTLMSDLSSSFSSNKNVNCSENTLHSLELQKSSSKLSKNEKSDTKTNSSLNNSIKKDNLCHDSKNDSDLNHFDINNDFTDCELNTNFESPNNVQNELRNISVKRKSEITEHSNNINSQTKKQKKSKSKTSTFETTSALNCEEEKISSDNESDVICIGTSSDQNYLQTNLSENLIHLSTDSCQSDSDSDTWCYTFPNNVDNIHQNKLKELWFINDEDKYRSRRNSGRYHESKLLNCNNCYQKGHLAKFCPNFKIPKCFICGNRHKPSQCKNRICGKCHRFGHDGRYCHGKIIYCLHCRMPGHQAHTCPDIWRRYHLTTTKKFIKPKKYSNTAPLFCYNCGHPGHFGGVCMERKMIMNTYPTWPCVINFKGTAKDPRQKFTNENKRRVQKKFDENPSPQKSASFIDKFLKDKEQAIIENKMKKMERRKEKKKMKKLQKVLSNNDQSQKEKVNLNPKFSPSSSKNLNFSQESETSENLSLKTVTTQNEILSFPRTPKKNLNLSLESEDNAIQNQSGKKPLNKKDRRIRNQRRKMRKKVAKIKIKNRIIDEERNSRPLIIKL